MKTKLAICAAALLASPAALPAQDTSVTQQANNYGTSSWFTSSPDDLYRANEFSLEAFGAGSSEGHNRDDDHFGRRDRGSRGGGGAGLDYFFCRYIGVEVDSLALANSHNTATLLGGDLTLRWPVGQTGFSPYVLGGGGEEWTYRSEGYGDGGAGLEYRFTRSFGLFGDGRFVSPGSTRDYGLGRIGVRFTF